MRWGTAAQMTQHTLYRFYFVQSEKDCYVNGDNSCMDDEANNMDQSSFTSVHFMFNSHVRVAR